MKYFLTFVFILFASISQAQMISPFEVKKGSLISYKQLSDSFKNGGEYIDGDYFVLVTADWCVPCRELKKQLKDKNFFGKDIGAVDLDADGELASKLISPRKTIPQLIRYRITENGKKIVKSFRDSESLEEFFKK